MKNKYQQRKRKLDGNVEFFKWKSLAPELRLIIIKKRDLKTKLRFSQCSKNSRTFVTSLKDVISKIEISDIPHDYATNPPNEHRYDSQISIDEWKRLVHADSSQRIPGLQPELNLENGCRNKLKISHNTYDNTDDWRQQTCDYWIEFEQFEGNKTLVKYRNWPIYLYGNGEVKWEKIEEGDTRTVTLRYLEYYLEQWGNVCPAFSFRTEDISTTDVDLNQMKNLKELQCGYYEWDGDIIDSCISYDKLINLDKLDICDEEYTNFADLKDFRGTKLIIQCEFEEDELNPMLLLLKKREILSNIRYFQLKTNSIHEYVKDFKVMEHLKDLEIFGLKPVYDLYVESDEGKEYQPEDIYSNCKFSMKSLNRNGQFDVTILLDDQATFIMEILWKNDSLE
ncbi:unnamed protein product [Caenorhabditis angaria]|uniref:Uncharacterized protein n=1 Tax=Caenorhabditis angaria TaxID=860376 RepID=A0A9P1NAG3_9PELO|nr:unnamed protein product [Caenorhabditis angaria]